MDGTMRRFRDRTCLLGKGGSGTCGLASTNFPVPFVASPGTCIGSTAPVYVSISIRADHVPLYNLIRSTRKHILAVHQHHTLSSTYVNDQYRRDIAAAGSQLLHPRKHSLQFHIQTCFYAVPALMAECSHFRTL